MQNQTLNGISPAAVNPSINYTGIIQKLKQSMMNNLQLMLLLENQGVITNNQTLDFMNSMNEMYKVNSPGIGTLSSQGLETDVSEQSPLDLFNKEHPDFFTKNGRKDVFEYIKSLDLDKDEISKIAEFIELLEKTAIDGYLKQSEHERIKNDENSAAKSKLTSYAQDAKFDSNNNRIYTRADIGKMSGDEFAKNEKIIFEQIKQGLLK